MRDGPGAGAVEGLAGPVKDQAPERQRQFRAACFRQDAGVRPVSLVAASALFGTDVEIPFA